MIDPSSQVTLEYNDFFLQTIEQTTLKTGWVLNDNHAYIPACNSNFLSQINGAAFKDNEEFKKIITATAITTVKVFRSGSEIVLTVPTEF